MPRKYSQEFRNRAVGLGLTGLGMIRVFREQ